MNDERRSGVYVWRMIQGGDYVYNDPLGRDGGPYPRMRLLWSNPLHAFVFEIQHSPGAEMQYMRALGAYEPQDRVFGCATRVDP